MLIIQIIMTRQTEENTHFTTSTLRYFGNSLTHEIKTIASH